MELIELDGPRCAQPELEEGGKDGVGAAGPARRTPGAQRGGAALLRGAPRVALGRSPMQVNRVHARDYGAGSGPKNPTMRFSRPSEASSPKSMPSSVTTPSLSSICQANRK